MDRKQEIDDLVERLKVANKRESDRSRAAEPRRIRKRLRKLGHQGGTRTSVE